MAKALITKEQVFDAADALLAEGKEVSALNLLERLGAGSLTTIYKHLNVWSAKRNEPAPMPTQAVPEGLQNSFASTAAAMWRAATAEAAKEVALVKERAEKEVQQAKKEFADALLAIERLEEKLDDCLSRAEKAESQIVELTAAVNKAENDKAGFRAAAEELKQQVKSQEAEIVRVHNELEQQRSSFTNELRELKDAAEIIRKEKEELAILNAQGTGQLDALKHQNSELLTKLTGSKNSSKLMVHIKSKDPATGGLKDPKLVSDNIEKNVLAPMDASKIQVQQEGFKGVFLTFELAGDEQTIKHQRERIAEQCRQEAEKYKCIAELE